MPILQIASLPYRRTGDAPDAPVEVLLVTSRGRWVLPKGNTIKGLTPTPPPRRKPMRKRASRARCARPLGDYRYRKQLNRAPR
jgi:hypothetical protein